MTAPLSKPPRLTVCPRCASPTETFVTTWSAPGTTGWGEAKRVSWLGRVTACTRCDWAEEG